MLLTQHPDYISDYHLDVSGANPTVNYIEFGYDARAGHTGHESQRGLFADAIPDKELTGVNDFEPTTHGSRDEHSVFQVSSDIHN